MSTQTTNLDMTLNSGSDKFDIPTINENFTKIDDAVGELNKNSRFHEIKKSIGFTSSTELSYTGGSVTIPAKSFFSITARFIYSSSKPLIGAFSKSPTQYNEVFGGVAAVHNVSITMSGYTDNELTYYLWAKYEGGSSEGCNIEGFYVTQDL